jgi:hypothetical protein
LQHGIPGLAEAEKAAVGRGGEDDFVFRDGVLKLCDTQTFAMPTKVDVREMIKGRHNMRLRQLGKPAGSIELGATLTEVAPGGISFGYRLLSSHSRRHGLVWD